LIQFPYAIKRATFCRCHFTILGLSFLFAFFSSERFISVSLLLLTCKPLEAYFVGVLHMSLSTGYLTSKQKLIWNLKNTGLQEASIARELKVTRQTVHKALDIANSKVQTSLEETAKINRIRIEKMDPVMGILVGYSTHFKTKALVTFSARNGVQIWYKHEGDCGSCEQLQTCREHLLSEAEERNVQLQENSAVMLPSELAKTLFTKLTGEKA